LVLQAGVWIITKPKEIKTGYKLAISCEEGLSKKKKQGGCFASGDEFSTMT
jgi:hypothetical protein